MNGRFLLLVAATALFAHLWTHARPVAPSTETAVVASRRIACTSITRKPVVREPNLPARPRNVLNTRTVVVCDMRPVCDKQPICDKRPVVATAPPIGSKYETASSEQIWTAESSPFVVPTCLVAGRYRVVATNGVIGQIEIPVVKSVGSISQMDFAQTYVNGVRVFWIRLQDSAANGGESAPKTELAMPGVSESTAVIHAPITRVQTESLMRSSCGDDQPIASDTAAFPAAETSFDDQPVEVHLADDATEPNRDMVNPDDYEIDRSAPKKFDFSFFEGTSGQ